MAKILIVEDSYIVALHLQTTLENQHYEVVGKCSSGEEAIELMKTALPDLVLMDIMLNGQMDGVEAASIIRRDYHLPVIYITALSDKDTIERVKITEPFGYLTKPFQDHEIFTVLNIALYKHSIERKLKASEAKYLSTINSMRDVVIVVDAACNITYMNPTAEALTRIPISRAIGKPLSDILILKDENTGQFPISALQCSIFENRWNTMTENISLVRTDGPNIPIGESSFSLMLNEQSEVSGLVLMFRDISEKKEYKNKIRQLEKQKITFLIEGQEKERSRIAKDLHDGLGQLLNAIKMNASVIVNSNDEGKSLYNLIDEAIQECVRISDNLMPSKLKDFDLATCLRSLCGQFKVKNAPTVHFETSGILPEVNQLTKINLYRIAQEAINNGIKHANAKSITVSLNEMVEGLQLTITDDGIGISSLPEMDLYKKNGLVNIKDRVEIMGGNLKIMNSESNGTSLVIEISGK